MSGGRGSGRGTAALRHWLLFALVLLFALPAAAAERGAPGRQVLQGDVLAYLADGSPPYDITEASSPALAGRYVSLAAAATRIAGPFWLRITLPAADGPRLLEVANPFIDRLRLYLPQPGGGFEVRRAGYLYPFEQRELALRHVLFRIDAHAGAPRTVYLYVEGVDLVEVPLVLWQPDALLEATQLDALLIGVFYGVLLATLLYNFAIYLFLGEGGYLSFVLYLLLWGTLQLSLDGLAFQYLWPDSPWLARHAPLLLTGACVAAAAQFSRQFLNLRELLPLLDRLWVLVVAAGLALALWGAYDDDSVARQAATVLGFVVLGLNLPLGWWRWRRGDGPALYFVLGWATFFASAGLSTLAYGGRPLPGSFGEHLVQGGACLEVLLLSLGLAQRITRLKREKRLAEERASRFLEDQARSLAQQVDERTQALREAVERAEAATRELEAKNVQLTRLAAYDGLTDLLNHRSFISRLQVLFADARRYRFPLCVVMVDLDYFKAVNDVHGHPIGDLALKRVAQALASGLRTGDLAARYGGEEFALVLPHCEGADAQAIAERLREAVAAQRFVECPTLRLTASFGIACLLPGSVDADPDRLLGRADAALYQAKRDGRDRVVLAPVPGAGARTA